MDLRYPLRETTSAQYRQRTAKNVQDSNATLLLTGGFLRGGTALTARLAGRLAKPLSIVDLNDPAPVERLATWLSEQRIQILMLPGRGKASVMASTGRPAVTWRNC